MKGTLFILSAPSGAGKTSLVNAVLPDIASLYPIERVITYTTKCPRPTDRDGHDYYFITEQEFKAKIAEGFFIEWSTAYGYYYGSPKYIIDEIEKGRSFILIIDRRGAQQIVSAYKNVVLIWIYTKDISVLKQRLEYRNTEKKDVINKRLRIAEQELSEEMQKKFYKYHVLNDEFETCLQELKCVIIDELNKHKK